VFGDGLAYLRRAYGGLMPEKDLRARVGALLRDHGDAPVLDALFKAQQASAVDPLGYMAGVLRKGLNGNRANMFSTGAPVRAVF
jgi:hypothetical protein